MSRRSLFATAPLAFQNPSRPNIVLFLADDHGYFDSPVYGNKVVRTPNLQRMAAEGMAFENVFTASPTCVPSRAVIMSGMLPARNGALPNHSGLKEGIRTLPSYMAQLGYRVAHFGKSHFQPKQNYPDLEWVASEIKGGPLNDDLDTGAFEKWLSANASSGKPLCLIVCCHSPHVYWMEKQGYDPKTVDLPPSFVDTPETREARAQYYTEVTKTDWQLGEIRASVARLLGTNTLLIYTSDNGAQWPFAKWSLYDAGIRLPFIAVWPGVIRPGTRSKAMISFADILPSIAEIAGGNAPEGIDGRSFASVLKGRAHAHRQEVYAAHSGDRDFNVFPMRCVRTSRFKYIRNLHPEFEYTTHIDVAGARDGRAYWDTWVAKARSDPSAAAVVRRYHEHPAEELYDVAADPHELRNLAAEPGHRTTLDALRSKVNQWMRQQDDSGPVFGKPRPLK